MDLDIYQQNYYLMPNSLQGQTRIFIKNKSDHFRTLVWYNPCYGKYTDLDNYQQNYYLMPYSLQGQTRIFI